jgi:hypothetical protein
MQMKRRSLKIATLTAVTIGISLHVFVAVADFAGQVPALSFALLAWASLPYLIGILLMFGVRRPIISLCAVLAPLIVDVMDIGSTYIAPHSSTAGLNLLWIPLWNMIVVQPTACFIAWILVRTKIRPRENAVR